MDLVVVGGLFAQFHGGVDAHAEMERLTQHIAKTAGIQAPLELPDEMTVEDYLARKISVLGASSSCLGGPAG